MNCNIPRQVTQMSPSEMLRIAKYYTEQMYNGMDRHG